LTPITDAGVINTIEVIELLSDKNDESTQKWYCYELNVHKNYSGTIGIEKK
jgi:hypothetical protein